MIRTTFGKANITILEDTRVSDPKNYEGLYYYELRHSSTDWYLPDTIELSVDVNFWGSILSDKPILKDDKKVKKLNTKTANRIKSCSNKIREFVYENYLQKLSPEKSE